jgi:outer membrane biosynthesis protein TonB
MQRAMVISMLLHFAVAALVYVGVPHLFEDLPIQEAVTTATFVPIAEARNLPEVLPVAEAPEPEPSEALPPQVKDTPPPPPPVLEVAEPEPPPARAPIEVTTLPAEIQRPRPKPMPPARLDFESALQSLEKMEPVPRMPEPETETTSAAADPIDQFLAEADTPHRLDTPLSQTLVDTIRSQIQRNWLVPAGARDVHEMRVTLRLQLRRDGTVERVEVDERDRMRMQSDPFYRTMAESAVRAVRKAEQFQYLPPKKYQQWRDIKLTFDIREMFG